MMWQTWTAFGIMFGEQLRLYEGRCALKVELGNVMDLAFFRVPDKPHIHGLNWRLMLASVRTRVRKSTSRSEA